MLTAIVFVPVAGALAILMLGRSDRAARLLALAASMSVLALTLALWARFDVNDPGVQFSEHYVWIPALRVEYFLGVDGLNTPLLALTGLLGVGAVLASWGVTLRVKEYFFWLLLLETGVLGVFASLDLLLFFLFWEVELVPMYMLISTWGSGRKVYSAMKFLIFTIAGSAMMLIGILAMYSSMHTFNMMELRDHPYTSGLVAAPAVFFLLLAAFAVKLPIWPFHTWLPDAHTDAPTAVSVMLAGVLLKMGGYGIIRLCLSMFPEVAQQYAWLLATLAVINVLYGAALVLWQKDLKRLIAYSSVSHMGFVLLGIASMDQVGLTGAALQMFSHGTITGLLFMVVGLVYDKAHTRHIPDLGGLANRMPFVTVIFLIAGLAALGLPTTSGFAAELLVFLGSFPVLGVATILAMFGVVLTAGYILWMFQRVFMGAEKPRFANIGDSSAVERIPLIGMVAAIMIVGIYPALVTEYFEAGLSPIVALFV
ncbi:MAG: NADH-quinone oxidoreductase subunit [Dehalococcoidia bacterium]|nr:NADH-quinone oxidoreductase subunit [Dehalococcoidia bacterium]